MALSRSAAKSNLTFKSYHLAFSDLDKKQLLDRTKQLALRIISLVEALPKTIAGRAIGNQIMRSGSSVAANYRAACRARSRQEFIAKLGIVVEESDETCFWLELIIESKMLPRQKVEKLGLMVLFRCSFISKVHESGQLCASA